ncbi:hypothetical protein [Endozoicomonas sp. SESOKO1]|uniref:hypothetical protein n=1 Tax=Endozoicomonas sp. SESOKO1 TaxID=2828742 RepID=UPI0021478505|nr:hypothetical protein [Endozoicomonas sp. SESOKO1]
MHEYNIEPLTPADQAFPFGIDISDISQSVFEQELRPVAVVNPPNPNQATSNNQTLPGDDIAEDNSSAVEHKIESYYERRKKRYYNDQAYAERERERQRQRQRKLRKDPDYLEQRRAYQNKRYQENPDVARRKREHRRERQMQHQRKHRNCVVYGRNFYQK